MSLSSLRWTAERALRKAGYRAGILMYHRVSRESHDPWDLCVTPEHFAQQMDVLRRGVDCVPLAALRGRWRGRSKRSRIAVTFDDGYRDNVLSALPILERYEIPATIFVVSRAVESQREFWWDTLERCLLRPRALPAQLEVTIGDTQHCWTLPPGESPAASAAWRSDSQPPSTARQRVFLELWNLLVTLDDAERDRILGELATWAGLNDDVAPERLPMSVADLARLAAHPLIEIGAHTAGHASLPDMSPAEQQREIADGRAALESWIGRPVTAFCYPYGRVARPTEKIVRRLKFALAVSTRSTFVTPLSGRWVLPRFQVTDGDGATFTDWLRGHFRGVECWT